MSATTAIDLVTKASSGFAELLKTTTPSSDGRERFDNRPTWDNAKPKFDNRPTWDNWDNKNWNKKK
ncbi:multiple cyclophane-containing RiPP AmcA [Streptomyces gamaensis]|uniref:Multiple cyclophane-containing RiPP AmcA n=1 Tax=Streptomyces gamaensis TaxID=1763542 RepID=A0ABW0YT18_9ACTN